MYFASNKEWENHILGRRTAVSDTLSYTSSSAPIACTDPIRGILYAPYHASKTSYGEQFRTLVLLKMPVMQPHRAESFVLIDSDTAIDGVYYENPVDAFSVFLDGIVRTFFLANKDQYYYIDFDPASNKLSKVEKVMCRQNNDPPVELNTSVAEKYLERKGMKNYNFFADGREHIIASAKPAWHNGSFYGTITSGYSQPIVFECKDMKTFVFKGVIPQIAKYECQLAIAGNVLYAILRGAEKENFFLSHDLGKTFIASPCRIPMAETRPQILEYENKILIGYSLMDIQPNLMRNGRNNMRLILGEGSDLTNYKEIFTIVDKYGIVYFDLINYKGSLLMLWSNSELYIDQTQRGMVHGKDLLLYSKIGDLFEYL